MRTPLKTLVHIGLSYNLIKDSNLTQITRNFPQLFCLDLQFNQLCDLSLTVAQISKLSDIKVLYLAGNPLALTFRYRDIIKQNFIDLRYFDGTAAFTEAEEHLKKKMRKKFTK